MAPKEKEKLEKLKREYDKNRREEASAKKKKIKEAADLIKKAKIYWLYKRKQLL